MSNRSKIAAELEIVGSKHPFGYTHIQIGVYHDSGQYSAHVTAFKRTPESSFQTIISEMIGNTVRLDKGRFSDRGLAERTSGVIRNPAVIGKLRNMLRSQGAELAEVHTDWAEALATQPA